MPLSSGDEYLNKPSSSIRRRNDLEASLSDLNFSIRDNFRRGNYDILLGQINMQESLNRSLFGSDSPLTIYCRINRAKLFAYYGIATESLSEAQSAIDDLGLNHASPQILAKAHEDMAEILSLTGQEEVTIQCKELFDRAKEYYLESGDKLEAVQSRFRLADFLFKLNNHDLAYLVIDKAVEEGAKLLSRNWAERERQLVLRSNS